MGKVHHPIVKNLAQPYINPMMRYEMDNKALGELSLTHGEDNITVLHFNRTDNAALQVIESNFIEQVADLEGISDEEEREKIRIALAKKYEDAIADKAWVSVADVAFLNIKFNEYLKRFQLSTDEDRGGNIQWYLKHYVIGVSSLKEKEWRALPFKFFFELADSMLGLSTSTNENYDFRIGAIKKK